MKETEQAFNRGTRSKRNDRPAGNTERPKNKETEPSTVTGKHTTSLPKGKLHESKNGAKTPTSNDTINGKLSKAPTGPKLPPLPGISPELVKKAGIEHIGPSEARDRCGLEQSGLWIPYFSRNGEPATFEDEDGNQKPFGRIRMDRPGKDKRYHQQEKSGVHAYFPPGLDITTRSIVLVEGEKKCLALQGQGVNAIGLSGFFGFRKKKEDGKRCELLEELNFLQCFDEGASIEYLGDNDTTLNHQFADGAIQLMERIGDSPEVSGVMLTLPRLPLDGPKGIDDLIQKWIDDGLDPKSEYEKLERIEIDLRDYSGKRGAADLRWKLLKLEFDRNSEGLKALVEGSSREVERLLKLIIRMKDAALSQKAAKDAVRELLGMEKREFNAALKGAQEAMVESTGNSSESEETRIRSKILEVAKKAHCIKGEILYPRDPNDPDFAELTGLSEAPSGYMRISREDFQEYLVAEEGLSKEACDFLPGKQSSIKNVIVKMNKKPNLSYAGPIAGYPAGYHKYISEHFLVTEGPTFIEGKEGECTNTREYIERLCGRDANEPFWEHQVATMYGLIAAARKMVLHYEEDRTVPPLVMAGAAGAGKSHYQGSMLHWWIGGRVSSCKIKNLTEKFNSEQGRAEVMNISDSPGKVDWDIRSALAEVFKERAANPMDTIERKQVDRITVPSKRLLTVSANDTAKAIAALPPVDGIEDKVIYLKTYRVDMWRGNNDPKGKKIRAAIAAEREAFCWFVDNFQLPEECRDDRFGVKGWQHESLVTLADSGAPHEHLAAELQDMTVRKDDDTLFGANRWFSTLQVAQALWSCDKAFGIRGKTPTQIGSLLGHIKGKQDKGVDWGFKIQTKLVKNVTRWKFLRNK